MNWWAAGYGIGMVCSWFFLVWDQLNEYGDEKPEPGEYLWCLISSTCGAFIWPIIVLSLAGMLLVRWMDKVRMKLRGVKL